MVRNSNQPTASCHSESLCEIRQQKRRLFSERNITLPHVGFALNVEGQQLKEDPDESVSGVMSNMA